MFNPGSMLKLMSLKNTFEGNHPKVVAFFKAVITRCRASSHSPDSRGFPSMRRRSAGLSRCGLL